MTRVNQDPSQNWEVRFWQESRPSIQATMAAVGALPFAVAITQERFAEMQYEFRGISWFVASPFRTIPMIILPVVTTLVGHSIAYSRGEDPTRCLGGVMIDTCIPIGSYWAGYLAGLVWGWILPDLVYGRKLPASVVVGSSLLVTIGVSCAMTYLVVRSTVQNLNSSTNLSFGLRP